MGSLSLDVFNRLAAPGPRLDWIQDWLLNQVWNRARYEQMAPTQFLEEGEAQVNELEEVIAAAAPRVYDELAIAPAPERDLHTFLNAQRPCAAIVFDGLSLREIPVALHLAERAGMRICELGVSFAAAASETLDFMEQRVGVRIAPSQIESRSELRSQGIASYYYSSVSQRQLLDPNGQALLLWSAFPDQTYSDSGARFKEHFQEIHTLFETAWMNTVQQVPRGRKILVTSDHGYVFFGSGLSFVRNREAVRPLTEYLGGERFRKLDPGEVAPVHSDLVVLPHKGVAMIRGRVQTHPPGQASNRLYKHGGLSLMEMLTPWIVLETS